MKNEALAHFKDWSNYLLVTTVAALGWVATKDAPLFWQPWMKIACIWSFALSAVCGIFTLALIPLVAEQQGETESFYKVKAKFKLFGARSLYMKQVCFPQHFLFIVGVVIFAVGVSAAMIAQPENAAEECPACFSKTSCIIE